MKPRLRIASDGSKALPRKVNFTDAVIRRMTCPPGGGRTWVYDSAVPGLGLMVTENGAKSFYWVGRVRGKHSPRRFLLGEASGLSVKSARSKAMAIGSKARDGIDPQDEKRVAQEKARTAITFNALWERYRTERLEVTATRNTIIRDASIIKLNLASWKHRQADSITTDEARALHVKIGKETGQRTANKAMELVRRMFRWARIPSPTAGFRPDDWYDEPDRDRFLFPDELKKFIAAVKLEPNHDVQDCLLLLLFTGARRGNVIAMRWDEINLGAKMWTIPGTKSKSRKTMSVPLVEEAMAILERRKADQLRRELDTPWVLPAKRGDNRAGHITSIRPGFVRALDLAGLMDVHLHDLRRTNAAYQASAGSSLLIIAKSLGHASTQATKVYARLQTDAVRQSLQTGVDSMMAAINGPDGDAKKS